MAEILKTVVDSLSALESIVRPSFGPQGIDVAMKTQSGHILLTNSGHLILNSLLMPNPVCRLVSQQVDRHIGLTGDGSKEIVIVLSKFLKCIYENVFSSVKIHHTLESSGLSQACGHTVSIKMPKVTEILEKYCKYQTVTNCNTDKVRRFITSILRTAIYGKIQEEALKILIDRTVDLILAKQNLEQEIFLHYISALIDQFKDICILTSGASIGNTNIINGFVIKRNSLGSIDSSTLSKPIKFIIIRDIFITDSVEFGTTQLNCNNMQLSSFFENKIAMVHRITNLLKSSSISVVLCSHGLPEHARASFGRQFFVIQHVHDEDIERISKFFKILPIETIGEVFTTNFACHSGFLLAVDQITVGSEYYVRLCPDYKQYENEYPSCQLILCSPHQSITQQYYSIILNMLKIIKMSCHHTYGSGKEGNCSMKYLPSATCVELIVAEYFATEAYVETDVFLRRVYKSLSDALLEIPKLIYSNSNRTNRRFIDTQRLLQDVGNKDKNDHCFGFGIDSETGDIIEPYKQDIIEPFSSKLLLISHALQVAQQILKIDDVLPARTSKKH